jgi:predicted negative regulator of RcsB-dependent stress response
MKEAVTQALATSNWSLAEQATTDLSQQFPKTHAASAAHLLLAKAALDQKKNELARQSLNWVVQHGTDEALVSLARLRLAGLWLDEGQPDQAKNLLSVSPAPGFEALFDDRLGDWALAAQQNNLAIEHYSKAWKALTDTSAMRQVIAIKLAALGVDVSTLK